LKLPAYILCNKLCLDSKLVKAAHKMAGKKNFRRNASLSFIG